MASRRRAPRAAPSPNAFGSVRPRGRLFGILRRNDDRWSFFVGWVLVSYDDVEQRDDDARQGNREENCESAKNDTNGRHRNEDEEWREPH